MRDQWLMLYFGLCGDVDKYGGFFPCDKSRRAELVSNESLGLKWKPPEIKVSPGMKKTRNQAAPGMGQLSPGAFLFQKEVWTEVESWIAEAGECFEMETPRGPYTLFHVTRLIDCVDRERSQLSYFDDEETDVMSVDEYALDESKLQEVHLFRTPETYELETLVSQQFVDFVKSKHFTGFFFEKRRFVDAES